MGFYQDLIVPHLVNLAMRNKQLVPYRNRIVSGAEGRVLEIGIGSGINLPLYTGRACEVFGIDPQPKLLAMASHRNPIITAKIIRASAESIPLDDASVDTVLTTWTLCTIPDVSAALAEIRRVLKPTGRFLFVEHGLAPEERVRVWQNRLNPIWKRIAGGCHLNRPISTLVQDAGFHIPHIQTGYMRGPKPITFMYEGYAQPV
jgi:ubiquinone/menaquinone biosynthesis C-methylase UbiE